MREGYYICIVTTRGRSEERESPQIAPNIEIRTAFMASWLRDVSEVAALKYQTVENLSGASDLPPQYPGPEVVTDEAPEETEDGDGDGEGPVPVDDHRHGPGLGQVVGDEEDEDQEEPDNCQQGGQPGDGLRTERAHTS